MVYDGTDRTYRLSVGGVGAALHRQGLLGERHAHSRQQRQLGGGVQLRRMGALAAIGVRLGCWRGVRRSIRWWRRFRCR